MDQSLAQHRCFATIRAIHRHDDHNDFDLYTLFTSAKDICPSRMFMYANSQALIDVVAGFDADFVAALEQQQADKLMAQEREALWSSCSSPTSTITCSWLQVKQEPSDCPAVWQLALTSLTVRGTVVFSGGANKHADRFPCCRSRSA
jgi:hypothetical protein